MSHSNLDATVVGAFLQHNVKDAKDLIGKMVVNQGWNEEHLHPKKRDMHTVNEMDMLSTKMDLLMKKIEEGSKKEQEAIQLHSIAPAAKADPWCNNPEISRKQKSQLQFFYKNNQWLVRCHVGKADPWCNNLEISRKQKSQLQIFFLKITNGW
jgi:hypothetical protein